MKHTIQLHGPFTIYTFQWDLYESNKILSQVRVINVLTCFRYRVHIMRRIYACRHIMKHSCFATM